MKNKGLLFFLGINFFSLKGMECINPPIEKHTYTEVTLVNCDDNQLVKTCLTASLTLPLPIEFYSLLKADTLFKVTILVKTIGNESDSITQKTGAFTAAHCFALGILAQRYNKNYESSEPLSPLFFSSEQEEIFSLLNYDKRRNFRKTLLDCDTLIAKQISHIERVEGSKKVEKNSWLARLWKRK